MSLSLSSNSIPLRSSVDKNPDLTIPSPLMVRRLRQKLEHRSTSIDDITNKKGLINQPDRYVCDGKVLGEGAYGIVYKAYDKINKKNVAMKVIPLKNHMAWHLEPILGLRLSHPGLVEIYDIYFTAEYPTIGTSSRLSLSSSFQPLRGGSLDNDELNNLTKPNTLSDSYEIESVSLLNIIFEYATHGDLIGYIIDFYESKTDRSGNVSEFISDAIVSNMARQIVSAVKYLHENNIAHRDIKPDNIVMSISPNGNITLKLIDLGMGCIDCASDTSARVGSFDYTAPEVFNFGEPYDVFLADIWSIGVIVYMLSHGNYPFGLMRNKSGERSRRRNVRQLDENDFGIHISLSERLFIYRCLKIDPKERADIFELVRHPFVTDYFDI